MSAVGSIVSAYVKVLRIPLDVANRALGRDGLDVDAAEASVTESVGSVLGDDKLREQGARKKAATGQRQRAARLRADAARREKAAAQTSDKAKSNLSELAKRERLEQLDEAADALGEREDAHTAADEAERLSDAAARVKSARKARA